MNMIVVANGNGMHIFSSFLFSVKSFEVNFDVNQLLCSMTKSAATSDKFALFQWTIMPCAQRDIRLKRSRKNQ